MGNQSVNEMVKPVLNEQQLLSVKQQIRGVVNHVCCSLSPNWFTRPEP